MKKRRDVLDEPTLIQVRAMIAEKGLPAAARQLDLELDTLSRAAAGATVLAGTRIAIRYALNNPKEPTQARSAS